MKTSYIIPFHKKDRTNDASNYIDRSEGCLQFQRFDFIVTTAIAFNLKSNICPEQYGFGCGRSATPNLILFFIVSINLTENRWSIIFFTDFRNASKIIVLSLVSDMILYVWLNLI